MTDNNNFQKGEEDQDKTPENPSIPQRPKHIFKKNQKIDPLRSKSAPAEEFTNDIDEGDDYIGSYNYFIYYNSIKPVDPRLPKPTYKPKPNLEFIKETKEKEDDDDDELGNDVNPLDHLPNLEDDFNQLKITQNSDNNEDFANHSLLNDNIKNNFPKNPNQKNKNNLNIANDTPSPLQYYSGSMNSTNQSNDMFQQQMWGDRNLGMNQMGLGMYNQGMGNMGNMIGMNMNPYMGMNMGMNYGNVPQFGNMIGMNPTLINQNYRMNGGNFQNTRGKKKGNTTPREVYDPMMIRNPMFNNMYNNQANNGFMFAQQNSMMNMNMMQMNQAQRNNMMQNDMNNFNAYQNMNNNSGNKNKKNKKGENYIRKEVNEYKNIEEIIEKAVTLSKDHSGSRLVQKKYEEGNEEVRNKIFEKLKPEILNLSKDIFGNYAIQKVLEFKDGEKNNYIMESLKGKIFELSVHMYGCRVMQQLISVIDEKYLSQITLELKDHYAKCIEDQNGNHVIQKLIERLKPGENSGIYEVVYNNIVELSKHQYGCRVIQTLLKKCNQEQISKILKIVFKNVKELSEDQYGNYIIQYILENQKGKNVDPIYEGLKSNIYDFSIHKYASNVVERALNFGNEEQRKNIINEIILQDDRMKECLISMVKDKFGNYVVQKLIEFSDNEMRNNIIKRITNSQSFKKKDGFSKHVINFIEKLNIDLTPNEGNDKNKGNKNVTKKGVNSDDHHI